MVSLGKELAIYKVAESNRKRSTRSEALVALLIAGNLLSGILITDIVNGGFVLLQNAVRLNHPDRIRRVLAQPT